MMTNITINEASETADNIIIQNFMSFLDNVSSAELFEKEDVPITLYDERGLVTLKTKKQHLIIDMLQHICDYLNVCMLYAFKSKNEKCHKVILYSLPVKNEMFSICLESYQYGIIEELNITFFSSLEIMFNELRKGLEEIDYLKDSGQVEINERQELTTLYSQFM